MCRRDQSLDAFAQACRSIGEPILGRPLHEISIARLLAQLFQVTEQFEMETQPQLLLLQKTMVLAEGVGRRLDPDGQYVEPGAAADRGMDARQPRPRGADQRTSAPMLAVLERLPGLVRIWTS